MAATRIARRIAVVIVLAPRNRIDGPDGVGLDYGVVAIVAVGGNGGQVGSHRGQGGGVVEGGAGQHGAGLFPVVLRDQLPCQGALSQVGQGRAASRREVRRGERPVEGGEDSRGEVDCGVRHTGMTS